MQTTDDMLGQYPTLDEVMDYVCHDNYILIGTTISVYLSGAYANREVERLLHAICDAKTVVMTEHVAGIIDYHPRQYAEQDF